MKHSNLRSIYRIASISALLSFALTGWSAEPAVQNLNVEALIAHVECVNLPPFTSDSAASTQTYKIPTGYSLWGAESRIGGAFGTNLVAFVCSKADPTATSKEAEAIFGPAAKLTKVDDAWYEILFTKYEALPTRSIDLINSAGSPAAFSVALVGQTLALASFALPPGHGGKALLDCAGVGFGIASVGFSASSADIPGVLISLALTGRSIQHCGDSVVEWQAYRKRLELAAAKKETELTEAALKRLSERIDQARNRAAILRNSGLNVSGPSFSISIPIGPSASPINPPAQIGNSTFEPPPKLPAPRPNTQPNPADLTPIPIRPAP